MKACLILLAAALIVALPFIFRREAAVGDWREGDPELIVVTPHNEAIRQEFGEGFSRWHRERYGQPVRIDWRVLGGTTEIMRYLASEYEAAAKRTFGAGKNGLGPSRQDVFGVDDPAKVSCGMDLFFGGGCFDHSRAEKLGLTVPAWGEADPPAGLFTDDAGRVLIPREMNGEIWRGQAFYGTVLSAFGLCYNVDRLRDLGVAAPPAAWSDLADARYFGQVGLADPTKSASVAKAFEMIIHERCAKAVADAGYTAAQVRGFEAAIAAAGGGSEAWPADVPAAYQTGIERGWVDGLNLVRRIGANARYFTDSAGKVPADVGSGAAAVGVAIDFLGRLQSELTARPGHPPVMAYVTPVGGSSVTADPVSLLRGAPHRGLAVRFIEYVLSEEGQRLWNYRVGEPGGPRRFALRRLPIRRDFYPSGEAAWQAASARHRAHLADPLWLPEVDAYRLGESFHYEARWTGRHFGVQRDLIRAMCMDSGDELKRAWKAILEHGGPERNPEAMRLLEALPERPCPLTWASAVTEYARIPRLDYLSAWTAFFRDQYRQAEASAKRSAHASGEAAQSGGI